MTTALKSFNIKYMKKIIICIIFVFSVYKFIKFSETLDNKKVILHLENYTYNKVGNRTLSKYIKNNIYPKENKSTLRNQFQSIHYEYAANHKISKLHVSHIKEEYIKNNPVERRNQIRKKVVENVCKKNNLKVTEHKVVIALRYR